MSNAKMSSLVAALVVPWVSQIGRILPPDWCIAEWVVQANVDGRKTVLLDVMRESTMPISMRITKVWDAMGITTQETDEEARAGFDEMLAAEIERLKGGAA